MFPITITLNTPDELDIVRRALAGEQPDKVEVTTFEQSEPHYVDAESPAEDDEGENDTPSYDQVASAIKKVAAADRNAALGGLKEHNIKKLPEATEDQYGPILSTFNTLIKQLGI